MSTKPNKAPTSGGRFCRCCLTKDASLLRWRLGDECFEAYSARDAILKILSDTDCSLQDNDAICNDCFETLSKTLQFIKTFKTANATQLTCLDSANDIIVLSDEESCTNRNAVEQEDHGIENDEQNVIEPDKEGTLDPKWNITFTVTQEATLTTEEQFFNKASTYLTTKAISKPQYQPFIESEAKQFDKIIVIPKSQRPIITYLLSDIHKNITVFEHSSAGRTKNKRLLLLGTANFCSSCMKSFPTVNKYNKHMWEGNCKPSKWPGIKPRSLKSLNCDVCGARFETARRRRVHMTKCAMLECTHCKEKMSSLILLEHSTIKHNDSRPFKCGKCKSDFLYYRIYKNHNCDRVKCEKCGRTPDSIVAHRCTPSTPTYRKCRYCVERVDLSKYSEHILAKHKKYFCRCKQGFMTSERLEAHKASACLFSKRLCNICGKLFTKGAIRPHMRTHEPRDTSISFECETCHKKYSSAVRLRAHIRNTHLCKEVICEYCGQKLRGNSISGHMQLKHSEQPQKYSCPISNCGKEFYRRDYVMKHLRTHQRSPNQNRRIISRRKISSDQEIICKFCLKTFKAVSQLKSHLVQHMRLVRYKCRYCPMTYSNYCGRLRHEKDTHRTFQNGFKCNTCWRIEPSMEQLNFHMETVHKKRNYKCELCGETFSRYFQLNSHLIAEHVQPADIEKEKEYILRKALSDYIEFDDAGVSAPATHLDYNVGSGEHKEEVGEYVELESNEREDITGTKYGGFQTSSRNSADRLAVSRIREEDKCDDYDSALPKTHIRFRLS